MRLLLILFKKGYKMELEFKINTGTVKIGKELSIFKNSDFEKLSFLENSGALNLFINLKQNAIKNTFAKQLTVREVCDYNIIKKNGFKSVTYSKKQRGCFITYVFSLM